MARLAGMSLRERWAGWAQEPFTSESEQARLGLGEAGVTSATGVLLVGGASSRFGSPKALARLRRRDARRAGVADRSARRSTHGSRSARATSSCRSRSSSSRPSRRRRSSASSPGSAPPRPRSQSSSRSTARSSRRRSCASSASAGPSRRPGRCRARTRSDDLPELERRLALGRLVAARRQPARARGRPAACSRTWTRRDAALSARTSTSPLSTSTGPDSVVDREPAVARDHLRRACDAVDGHAAAAEEVAGAEVVVERVEPVLAPRVVAVLELEQQVGEERAALVLAARHGVERARQAPSSPPAARRGAG